MLKITWNSPDKSTGVYSFCMCPGGLILSSGTETNGVVSNGMSNYRRNSPFANAAIVVSVDPGKNSSDKFSGLKSRNTGVEGNLDFRRYHTPFLLLHTLP